MLLKKINEKNKPAFFKAFMAVGIAFLFFLYDFFLRVAPSSMLHELMKAFSANASSVGLMSGFFFFAYAPMQIPVGLLCDRYGPKVWLTIAVFCCGVFTLVFSITNSLYIACFSRFMIGLASSFAFVGPLVIATRWFETKYLTVKTTKTDALVCCAFPIYIHIHTFFASLY